MQLKRSWARVCKVLVVAATVFTVASFVVDWCLAVAIPALVAYVIVTVKVMHCPNCGSRNNLKWLTWGVSKQPLYCPNCSRRIRFDDEPLDDGSPEAVTPAQ